VEIGRRNMKNGGSARLVAMIKVEAENYCACCVHHIKKRERAPQITYMPSVIHI
jgi:hypothetical protein